MMKVKIETRLIHRKERAGMRGPEYRSLFSKPRIKIYDDSKLQLLGNAETRRLVIKEVLDLHDFGPDVRELRSIGNGQYVMTAPDLDPNDNGGNAFDIEIYCDAGWPEIRKLVDQSQPFWCH